MLILALNICVNPDFYSTAVALDLQAPHPKKNIQYSTNSSLLAIGSLSFCFSEASWKDFIGPREFPAPRLKTISPWQGCFKKKSHLVKWGNPPACLIRACDNTGLKRQQGCSNWQQKCPATTTSRASGVSNREAPASCLPITQLEVGKFYTWD